MRSIEMMLGIPPMNKFDSVVDPMIACFGDTLDLTPYKPVANNIPLDEPNPGRAVKLTGLDKFWHDKSMSLDWSHVDAADPYWLNRIVWYSLFKDAKPYPARPGEAPGQFEADDDDD
jgi:hypothetical protein